MQFNSRILALPSALLSVAPAAVSSVAANNFFDPHALALQCSAAFEKLINPSPIRRPSFLTYKAFRAGLRAHLKRARRDYFARLIQLGGSPASKLDPGKPAVMNRATRRAAARSLRHA